MTRTTLKRGGAALLAFSLAFVGLSFVFSQPISAHAEETATQKASLEVTFDFDSLPSDRPTFKDMVRVYQWSVDKKTKKDQAISKDTKTISLTPLGDDKTINFYVYVGKDQGYGPEISDRDLYSFSGKKAKTAELSNVHVGRSLEISFANLMDSKDSLPEIPTDASLYEPLFLEEPNTPDSFSSIEQGASELVLPRVMFKPKNGVPLIKVPSGDFSLSLKTTPFGAEVINPGYLRLGPIDIDAQLGKHNINVEITYADGSKESATASFIVTEKLTPELESQLWDISYPDLTLEQREHIDLSVKATLFGKERALPRAVTFAKGTDMPSWVTVDPKTGKVTANPDEYAAAQDYEFTVAVTHLDGKVTTVPVKITITKADNAPELKSQLWKLSYADTAVQQLKTASVDLTATLFGKERALPRAVTFAKGTDMPSWVTVDPKTGTITVKPSEYVELKDYVFHVVVTHLDGKTEKVAVKIKVTEADPETTYPLTPLKPGKHTIPALELTPAQPNAKPQTPKPVETPSTGLAKTGISLTGLAGLALISTLTGATIVRRRKA
ncbi:Rib/alpha-like domain-containing protein [Arcanobacterium phocae]|uniref:Rib/alpha-like domain-containing protein n=3 Tax=Arcanobacterium phocae TaxID=131112 RepID=UPI001C0EB0FA|nr:Rib/alpha-like domain-containing protein [Arcanobacterium phocae]